MNKLSIIQDLKMGCDPEFFFSKGGRIIGAEHVLPKEGLTVGYSDSKFIIDGVQAELNPKPSECRGVLGNIISDCFRDLQDHMESVDKEIKADFHVAVKVREAEFKNLSDNCKRFGCSVSFNITPEGRMRRSSIDVDPYKYKWRAAGGHIHMGEVTECESRHLKEKLQTPEIMVPVLDIIAGNTCVLVDRDKGNKERRKTYGRAGEYRKPPHGLEYRTLSNFWLRSPELFSLAFGLARTAVQIVVESDQTNDFVGELHKRVKMEDVAEAINTNNATLALKNFLKIEDLLMDITPQDSFYPIHKGNIYEFKKFIKKADNYFTEDPLKTWTNLEDAHVRGFNYFLSKI